MKISLITIISVLNKSLYQDPSIIESTVSRKSKGYIPRIEKPTLTIKKYMQEYCQLPLQKRTLAALRSTSHTLEKHQLFLTLLDIARDQNMPESELQRINNPIISQGWKKEQQLILLITDDLTINGSIQDRLLQQLSSNYTIEQILSFVLCISQPDLLL